jgi:hypothetical protein
MNVQVGEPSNVQANDRPSKHHQEAFSKRASNLPEIK